MITKSGWREVNGGVNESMPTTYLQVIRMNDGIHASDIDQLRVFLLCLLRISSHWFWYCTIYIYFLSSRIRYKYIV